jgi:hypothetical protein
MIPYLFNDVISVEDLYSVGDGIGKDSEGRDCGLFNLLFRR